MKMNYLDKNFLTGTWKNDFISNGEKKSEICDIRADGRYFIDGKHWFNVVNFKYDFDSNTISFTKSAVKPGDDRKFYNTVLVIDSNYLVNTKDDTDLANGYSLCYRRLSSLLP